MYDREKKSEYYQNNKDRLRENSKQHYQNNKEKHKQTSKEWAEHNPESIRIYKQKYKNKQKQILRELSRSLKTRCSNCSCINPDCIDWHHTKGKDILISRMIKHGYSTKKFLEEVQKCIPLCANCHRKHHFPNKPKAVANSKGRYVYNIKQSGCCIYCGESHSQCLDFHHKNPKNKVANISVIIRQTKYNFDDLLLELDKCVLICVNCHRLL